MQNVRAMNKINCVCALNISSLKHFHNLTNFVGSHTETNLSSHSIANWVYILHYLYHFGFHKSAHQIVDHDSSEWYSIYNLLCYIHLLVLDHCQVLYIHDAMERMLLVTQRKPICQSLRYIMSPPYPRIFAYHMIYSQICISSHFYSIYKYQHELLWILQCLCVELCKWCIWRHIFMKLVKSISPYKKRLCKFYNFILSWKYFNPVNHL